MISPTYRAVSSMRRFSSTIAKTLFSADIAKPEQHVQKRNRRNMKIALQQFNDENKYIHRHVRIYLNDYSISVASLSTLEINPLLNELRQFTEKDHQDELTYKHERSELFKRLKSSLRKMSLKQMAILMTSIKTTVASEFRVLKKMVDVDVGFRLRIYAHEKNNRKLSPTEIDSLLYLADVYFDCNTLTTFVPHLVILLSNKNSISLSDNQLMYVLFLIILERDHFGLLSRYERRIMGFLDRPSFEDLSTICMSYFKTQSQIKNEALRKIIDRMLDLLPSIDFTQPGYCAVIKSIRYSRDQSVREDVLKLVRKVLQDPYRDRIFNSLYNLTQTVKLMETNRIYDQRTLDRIGESVFKETDELRIKDIQNCLTTLANFKWRDLKLDDMLKQELDSLCQFIVEESRLDVKFQYAHLLPIMRSFMIFGYYNDQLIEYTNRILNDDDKMNQMRSKFIELEKTMLLLYTATRLESSGSKLQPDKSILSELSASINRVGSRGSIKRDSSIGYLSHILQPKIDKEIYLYTNKMRSIAESLLTKEGLNSPEIHHNFQFTMAHQNYADLVISKDRPAPGSYDPVTFMPRPIAPGEKHCLIYAVQNFDFMDACDRLSGYKELIMRLLKRLGYNVIILNLDEPDIVQLSNQIRSALQED